MELKNKVAYITGGSKGIGYGVAESLLRKGMKVAISSRSYESAKKAADSLIESTGSEHILPIESDVKSLSNEQAAIQKIVEKFGSVDAVLANAGLGVFKPIYEMEESEWRDVIDTNLNGVFNTTKASVEELKKSKGYLLTLASLAGTNFFPSGSAYNASKFGVVGFSQAVMLDVRQDDVKVSTIMPGSVATHFNGNEPSPEDAWKIQPEDIGKIVVDLLEMDARTLPSKVEVRPSKPPQK